MNEWKNILVNVKKGLNNMKQFVGKTLIKSMSAKQRMTHAKQ